MVDFLECFRKLSSEVGGKIVNLSGLWVYKIEGVQFDTFSGFRDSTDSFSKLTAEWSSDSPNLEVCIYVDDWAFERNDGEECPEPFSGSFSFENKVADSYEDFLRIFKEGIMHLYGLANEYYESFLDDEYVMVLAYKDGDRVKFVRSSMFNASDDVDAEQKGRETLMREYPREIATSIGTYLISYDELFEESLNRE